MPIRFRRKKVNVDMYGIESILKEFIVSFSPRIVIGIESTDRGEVILHTNMPGILIGRHGSSINGIRERCKAFGATKVTVKEMRHGVSNCGIW